MQYIPLSPRREFRRQQMLYSLAMRILDGESPVVVAATEEAAEQIMRDARKLAEQLASDKPENETLKR